MSGPNVRLADPLKSQAAALARSQGLSLNALVAIAVRNHLDSHQAGAGSDAAIAAPTQSLLAGVPGKALRIVQKSGSADLALRLDCPRRFKPSGLLGRDFFVEWRRSTDSRWYRDCDPRRIDLDEKKGVLA